MDFNRRGYGDGIISCPRWAHCRGLLRFLRQITVHERQLLEILMRGWLGRRPRRRHPSELLWQESLEERAQVQAASDDDASAYLGDRPGQSGPYTPCYVATVRYVQKHVDTQTGDNDVARALSANSSTRPSADLRTVNQVRR